MIRFFAIVISFCFFSVSLSAKGTLPSLDDYSRHLSVAFKSLTEAIDRNPYCRAQFLPSIYPDETPEDLGFLKSILVNGEEGFMPCPGYEIEGRKALDVLRRMDLNENEHVHHSGVYRVGEHAFFKKSNNKKKDQKKRNTDREFVTCLLAHAMGLGDVVAPVAQIKWSDELDGNIEKNILFLNKEKKKIITKALDFGQKTTGQGHLDDLLKFSKTLGSIQNKSPQDAINNLPSCYNIGDISMNPDMRARISVQNIQDLFIVIFITGQMDAHDGNFMAVCGDEDVRLKLIDTEYSLTENPIFKRNSGEKFRIATQKPAIFSIQNTSFNRRESVSHEKLTQETLDKVVSIKLNRLLLVLKEFYPEMAQEDLMTFTKRFEWLQCNMNSFFKNNSKMEDVWIDYYSKNVNMMNNSF